MSHLKYRSTLIVKSLHLRWLTTENFLNYETVKGGCIPSKNMFKTQKSNKLTWLASDINFKLLHTGCPIAHGITWVINISAIHLACHLSLLKLELIGRAVPTNLWISPFYLQNNFVRVDA